MVMPIQKALIAMSGGVDSSVAAYLSLREGFSCVGAIDKMCDRDLLGTAYSEQSIADAQAVADRLGIEFHVLEATAAFKQAVVADFIGCYEQGLTPNPVYSATNASSFLICWIWLWIWTATALLRGITPKSGKTPIPDGIYFIGLSMQPRTSPISLQV